MIAEITGLGIGLVIFAVAIGAGVLILDKFGNASGGTSNTTSQYLLGQLGQSGLAGYAPAIIAVVLGALFIGMIMRFGGKARA
jgi:hypothetical protein